MGAMTRMFPGSRAVRRSLMAAAVAAAIFVAAGVVRVATLSMPAPAPAALAAPAKDPVTTWQERLVRDPENANAYAQLGLALLQQVREDNDVTLYAKASQAFAAALARDPQQVDALTGQGMLALALHDFHGALGWADRVLAANPYRAAGLGIRVDGLVELGRYDEAVQALQQMIDLRPDLESYSRVSYVRELHGDLAGAVEAMQLAANSALPGSEPWLWTTTHLANLYVAQGQLDTAEALYRAVLRSRGDYPFAQLGLARLAAGRGDQETALHILKPLAARLPLPEILVTLGEVYEANGDRRLAQEQYDLVRVIQQLNAGAGMNVDLELATFEVNHGLDPAAALKAAQAAYAARPTIYAADTLAWALHRTGDNAAAWRYSQEALRLGTQDRKLHEHAAAIEATLGRAADSANAVGP